MSNKKAVSADLELYKSRIRSLLYIPYFFYFFFKYILLNQTFPIVIQTKNNKSSIRMMKTSPEFMPERSNKRRSNDFRKSNTYCGHSHLGWYPNTLLNGESAKRGLVLI